MSGVEVVVPLKVLIDVVAKEQAKLESTLAKNDESREKLGKGR